MATQCSVPALVAPFGLWGVKQQRMGLMLEETSRKTATFKGLKCVRNDYNAVTADLCWMKSRQSFVEIL